MVLRLLSPSVARQFIIPSPFSPAGSARTVFRRGKQMQLAMGTQHVAKWTNEIGREKLNRIMPDLMKISRERRPHLWSSTESFTADPGQDLSVSSSQELTEVKEEKNIANVPSFARFAEFRDSQLNFKPTKLHCVWRCAKISGNPKYQQEIMLQLKLDTPIHKMVILKNTPEINYKLWQVKHMIRIKPLTFPDGIPTEENFKAFLLKRNGEFVQSRLYRENYKRERNRPELEKYVLLRWEKEADMRKKWYNGSLDGTLLPTIAVDQRPARLMAQLDFPRLGKGCTSTHRKTSRDF